jgi:hypothetical protein
MRAFQPWLLSVKRGAPWFAPPALALALALAYPFLLRAFSDATQIAAGQPGIIRAALGWFCLFLAASVPFVGLACAYKLRDAAAPGDRPARARSLAYLTVAAPPLFVFIEVTRGLIGHPLSDEAIWLGLWGAAIVYIGLRRPATPSATSPRLRVVHGMSAALILVFIAFHLTNHLSGLVGSDVHAAIMKTGRAVYHRPVVEVLLIALLLLQIATGVTLAVRWSRLPGDGFRVLQIGSGLYIASFIVTHLNSALIGARAMRHVETDWAWASGAPEGLIHDAWNIRLVPHYGWGVFFVLTHLLLGLRQVLIAHAVPLPLVNRLWAGGLLVCGALASAIMAGLSGLRV